MRPLFCSSCGARLVDAEIEERLRRTCPQCGRVAWENPVPAAAVAVLRRREVLLCRRSIEPFRGQWGLPAGYQEIDETIETTAVREVREETGLLVRLTGLLDVRTTPDDHRKPSLLIVYQADEVGGELVPGSDCDEVGFYDLDALPDELAFENNRVILERLRSGASRTW